MFCGECGTKNVKGNKFCKECGSKLEVENEKVVVEEEKNVNEVKPSKTKKNPSKNKNIIMVLLIIAVALGGSYYYLNENVFNPEIVVENYFDALEDRNFGKVYDILNIESSDFTTKDKYIEINEIYETNYDFDIKDVDLKSKSAVVEYEVKVDGYETEDTIELKLDGKKYFIFDNWVLDISEDSYIKKDYELSVIKDSNVKIDGKEIDKYLDKDKSDDGFDVYVIPTIFMDTYDLEVETQMGIVINDKITPEIFTDSYIVDDISIDNMSEEQKEEISNSALDIIQKLYDDVILNEKFIDVEDDYKKDDIDIDSLEDEYNDLSETIRDYVVLNDIVFENSELSSLDIDSNGNILVSIYVDYDYEIEFEELFGDDIETKEDTVTNKLLSINMKYIDDEYYLSGIYNVPSYFSKY